MGQHNWKFGTGQTTDQERREIRRALANGHAAQYMREQAQARQPKPKPVKITTPSPAEIDAAKTRRGGYSRVALAQWGVPWPPPRGWQRQLEAQWHAERDGQTPRRPRGWSGPIRVRFECPACGGPHRRADCRRPGPSGCERPL